MQTSITAALVASEMIVRVVDRRIDTKREILK
jgi:hypothetical protein